MFETIRNAWKVAEIRKKLLYTLFIIIVFRFGSALTVPFLTLSKVQEWMSTNATDGNFLEYLNILTGGALSKATIFSLSITPYINASIIIQLLTYALPPLERLQSEGETGRKKLNQITAFVALGLSIFMSVAYYFTLKNMGAVKYTTGFEGVFAAVVISSCFVAGAMLVVWMGNRINDKGIGNGISMILFAGIVARFPTDVGTLITLTKDNPSKYLFVSIAIAVIYVVMIGFVVFMNESERRIPIQYAKRVVGRKQYGGQSTHIPVKVCMSGVMPIIFAMSFMSLPSTIGMFKGPYADPDGFWQRFYNGGIPGIRPGKPTSDYIQRVLSKITLVGAFFLGIIAIFPIILGMFDNNLRSLSMGGTTVLIVVSVALETVRTLESQMMMRHHKGFLE